MSKLSKPTTFNGDLRSLPDALAPFTSLGHWVLWRWEKSKARNGKEGKWTKVPYQANGTKASSTNPATWSTYADAISAMGKFDGIGFCLFGSQFAAFDIDNCRDPATSTLDPWAQKLVERVGSYTEVTVSGTGLRIIGRGIGSKVHRKQPVENGVTLEAYRQAERYIVITGNPLPGSKPSISNIDAHIDETVAELDAKKKGREENKPGTADDGGHHARQEPDDEDELWRTINDGGAQRHGPSRSENQWWVVNEMLRRGYMADAIIKVLLDGRNRISDHVRDQGNPREYVKRQLAKAKQSITLATDDGGKPYKSVNNIIIALLKLGVTVRYDQFADRILIDGLPEFGPTLDDAAVIRIWLMMERRFRFRPTKDMMFTVIVDTARLNGFDPVRDYLDGLQWDGIKRIDRWLTIYAQAEENEYTRAVGALMLVAAVRRVRQPGCKFDEMVVLEDPEQGTDKSTALAMLAVKEEWFSDDLPLNLEGKRVIEALRGRWIIEAAELSGMRRTDIEHVKALLSRQRDRGRLVWDRIVSDVPRQNIVVGTTNSSEYLRDTSGNRRFWPVKSKRFDIAALKRDRDQLWAEAAAREATRVSIRLPPELWQLAAEEQAQRLTDDPYLDALQHALGDMQGKISSEAVWGILDVKPGQRGQDHSRRVGEAMRKLGWQRPNKKMIVNINGKHVVGWVKGEQPWRAIEVFRDKDLLSVSYGDMLQ